MENIDKLTVCPKCGADWDDGDIYEYFRKTNPDQSEEEALKSAKMFGWSNENRERFSRLIGVEISGNYDGVSYWQCPDCGTTWNRFTNKEEPIW